MVDRTIILAPNGRHSARGVTVVNPQEFLAYQDQLDALTYVFDLKAFLEGATISSVSRVPVGSTVTNTSNTTTQITQRMAGFGYVDIAATLSTADVQQFRLTIEPRASNKSQWWPWR